VSLLRKEVRAAPKFEAVSYEGEHPLFSFRYLQAGFCIRDCSKEQRAAFATRLKELSCLTWGQIRQSPRHGLGYEIIGRGSFKVGIPAHVTPETHLLAFRCFGKAPMVGYKVNDRLYVLWLDPNFKVYSHG
jgi:hypothetical protein